MEKETTNAPQQGGNIMGHQYFTDGLTESEMKEWLEIRNKFDEVRLQNSIEKAQKLDAIDCAHRGKVRGIEEVFQEHKRQYKEDLGFAEEAHIKEVRFWKVKYMERNAKLEVERQREYAKFRNTVARRRAEEAERNNRKTDGQ